MPKEGNRLPRDLRNDMVGIVIAVRSRKNQHAEFHTSRLAGVGGIQVSGARPFDKLRASGVPGMWVSTLVEDQASYCGGVITVRVLLPELATHMLVPSKERAEG